RGGDGGGLDRHPQHTEVVDHDRAQHGGQEGLHEYPVDPGAPGRGVAVVELGPHVVDGVARGDEGHQPDPDDHESAAGDDPDVARNATSAMPLASSRKPTIWVTALRRVASTKNPMSTTAIPMGMARVSGEGSRATMRRVVA